MGCAAAQASGPSLPSSSCSSCSISPKHLQQTTNYLARLPRPSGCCRPARAAPPRWTVGHRSSRLTRAQAHQPGRPPPLSPRQPSLPTHPSCQQTRPTARTLGQRTSSRLQARRRRDRCRACRRPSSTTTRTSITASCRPIPLPPTFDRRTASTCPSSNSPSCSSRLRARQATPARRRLLPSRRKTIWLPSARRPELRRRPLLTRRLRRPQASDPPRLPGTDLAGTRTGERLQGRVDLPGMTIRTSITGWPTWARPEGTIRWRARGARSRAISQMRTLASTLARVRLDSTARRRTRLRLARSDQVR